jgi:hypothetical protein
VKPRVAFLLGAGVSMGADLPGTAEVTRRVEVMAAEARATQGLSVGAQESRLVGELLTRLRAFAEPPHDADATFNYEILHYLCRQVAEEGIEFENPLIVPAIRRVTRGIVSAAQAERNRFTIEGVAAHALGSIQRVVTGSLFTSKRPIGHLDALVSACRDSRLSAIDVATLNHDTLIEGVLQARGILYEDGFLPVESGLREWIRGRLMDAGARVRLLKLHGSVDWHRVRPISSDHAWYDDRWIQVPELDQSRLGLFTCPPSPLILIGTTDKILDYVRFPFVDILCAFRDALGRSSRLVVSGYSFGDKAINSQIADWYYTNRDRRIVAISPEIEGCLERSRWAMRDKWMYWRSEGRLVLNDARFGETAWEAIADQLGVSPTA